jgi:hypothetical protein
MSTLDRFKQSQGPWPAKAVQDQARSAVAVTPSDTTDLPGGICVALYLVTGDVKVTLADMDDGTFVTFSSHATGYFLCQVKRVWTATTATNILALY